MGVLCGDWRVVEVWAGPLVVRRLSWRRKPEETKQPAKASTSHHVSPSGLLVNKRLFLTELGQAP